MNAGKTIREIWKIILFANAREHAVRKYLAVQWPKMVWPDKMPLVMYGPFFEQGGQPRLMHGCMELRGMRMQGQEQGIYLKEKAFVKSYPVPYYYSGLE